MVTVHFSKVGVDLAGLAGAFVALGIVGLLFAGRKPTRWAGLLAAASCALVVLGPIAFPYCLVFVYAAVACGNVIDQATATTYDGKQVKGTVAQRAFGLAVQIPFLLMVTGLGKGVELNSASAVAHQHLMQSQIIPRPEVVVEDRSFPSKFREWTVLQRAKAGSDLDLMTISPNEFYWDHAGHILRGSEVAARIRSWSSHFGDLPPSEHRTTSIVRR